MEFPIKVTPTMEQPIKLVAHQYVPDITECDGVTPCNPIYCEAKENYNTRRNIDPRVIKFCYSTKDIREALGCTKKKNISFRIRGRRHDYEENCSVTEGMVIDIRSLDYVRIDPCTQTVKVGAGTAVGKLATCLARQGYMLPLPPEQSIGIAGSTSVGGIGFSSRYLGLTCDYLKEVELVDGEGKVIVANKQSHEDLFWAIRGGLGANFGIITALTFHIVPIQDVVVCEAVWRGCGIRDVIYYWQDLCHCSENQFTSRLKLSKCADGVLELSLKGQFFGKVSGLGQMICVHLGKMAFSGFHVETLPYDEAIQRLGESVEPHPFKATGSFQYRCMTYDEIGCLISRMEKTCMMGTWSLELISLGGKIKAVDAEDTAYVHRQALYLIRINASWENPIDEYEAVCWVNETKAYLDQVGQGTYRGFTDFDLDNWQEQYYGSNYSRLMAVKQKYDPNNVFQFPQSIE